MVAAGIFLVARLFPLFKVIPYIMYVIAFIGIITLFFGATLALAQKDIKRSLAYSTMSQLGYMMLALGMGSYRAALFHLITHAYSKALLFLGSGSLIHSMETLVGYSPEKSQNMVLMGGLTKHLPITKTAFLIGTLSLSFFLYKPIYSPLKKFGLINSFDKGGTKSIFLDKIINFFYNWSSNRGYIDAFYATYFFKGLRGLTEFVSIMDRRLIDGIPNGFGITSFFVAESF
ncbi:hypothetical protein RND81_O107400, partial [Saponaria officinalis]